MPRQLVLVASCHTVAAQQPQSISEGVVVCGDHATFAGMQVLGGVKAEGCLPVGSDRSVTVAGTVGLRCVLDDCQFVLCSELRNR